MKFLRNRFTARAITAFLLLTFIQSVFLPYYSFALTSGSSQPEFTSYEETGSTDMVNLITGDFNFNIPLLEVPGPEGNFALPLSYHSGIGLEQESSWCGLGFNINPGAIIRSINQYPDDASGEPHYVTVQDLTGVNGWNRTFNHPFKDDWNSQTGYHGNVNLLDIVEVDFGNRSSVGVVGVHVGDGGVSFDPVQFGMAAMTILSYGVGGTAMSAASVAKQAAINLAINSAISFAMPVNTPGNPTSGTWQTTKTSGGASIGVDWRSSTIGSIIAHAPFPVFYRKKSYHIFIDQTRTEDMYGLLYLGNIHKVNSNFYALVNNTNMPVYSSSNWSNATGYLGNEGDASDINFNIAEGISYKNQNQSTVLASDDYLVYAPGVSGSIKPHRLEVGSVSMPMNMDQFYTRYLILPHLSYKVPFIYENSNSNKYLYHLGNNTTDPTQFNYGMQFNNPPVNTWRYKLDDSIFGSSQRIQSDVSALKKLPQANNIEWFSNHDLRWNANDVLPLPAGFLEFLSNVRYDPDHSESDRYNFRFKNDENVNPYGVTYSTSVASFSAKIPVNDPSFLKLVNVGDPIRLKVASANFDAIVSISAEDNSSITVSSPSLSALNGLAVDLTLEYKIYPSMGNGIGAYMITGADGTSYHFALPSFAYDEKSESFVIDPTTHQPDPNKKSIINRYAPFANMWLLTAITGSDYVDRNANGLADEGDWGYWVKMNYGKHSDTYDWRIPYTGTIKDPTGKYAGYERGRRQLFYLNSIETRSHVALFMKSDRYDGLDVSKTTTPQKLDEICLLRKEQYAKLKLAPYNMSNYSNTISVECKSADFNGAAIRDYINKNCLKRIIFNYSYDLCKGTPNTNVSANPQQGKLTLTSIAIKGRNDVRVVPDYKFTYDSNPNYYSTHWDGWGMYNNGGDHNAIGDAGFGSAWSMTKCSTPVGTDILVEHERDTYSSISGEKCIGQYYPYGQPSGPLTDQALISIPKPLNPVVDYSIGDKIRIGGEVEIQCQLTAITKEYSGDFIISDVTSTNLILDRPYVDLSDCGPGNGSPSYINSHSGMIAKIDDRKPGGNIRVASIRMVNELGKENKLRYLYTNDDGSSSGVVSQEPNYIKTSNFPFYDYVNYPQTPVMYGKVSVLSGKLTTDDDYTGKQVFEFETPDKSFFNYQPIDQGSSTISGTANTVNNKLFKIEDKTSKMGTLKSVKIYDRVKGLISQSQLEYTAQTLNDGVNNNQGFFSEGTLMTDVSSNGSQGGTSYKVFRTTIVKYPYSLKKITNTKDGFSSSTENLSWDLLTGVITQKLDKSSQGVYVKTVTKPAYTIKNPDGSLAYSELGAKGSNVNNKNMLTQNAATYTYRSDAIGNSLGLISATIATWRKDWSNYRKYDITSASYVDEGVQANQVWRKGPAYVWKGNYSRYRQDGSQNFATTDDFNFSANATNALWQYLGETKRFDHYGMPLEAVDMSNIFAATKMGYDDRAIIARAANASYNEIAFSSAEDKISSKPYYFGGEVALDSGKVVTAPVHTGYKALSVSSGHGFVFKSSALNTTKTYRASVWANNTNGRIYYKLNNGSEVVPSTQTISKPVAIPGMGNWYRIDLTINNPTSSIEVGVKSNSGTVVFDDFRFQPSEAVMTCYVYLPLDFEFSASSSTSSFSYTLDNNNMFTKYESNEKGQLIKTYVESFMNGVQLLSEAKSDYRKFHVGQ